ncbi:MAG: hypothetical protein KIT81_11850 [Alphaproteobacteria bacterium]|nr:hypothetical protein [Alphaproteobacteria bacterium]
MAGMPRLLHILFLVLFVAALPLATAMERHCADNPDHMTQDGGLPSGDPAPCCPDMVAGGGCHAGCLAQALGPSAQEPAASDMAQMGMRDPGDPSGWLGPPDFDPPRFALLS